MYRYVQFRCTNLYRTCTHLLVQDHWTAMYRWIQISTYSIQRLVWDWSIIKKHRSLGVPFEIRPKEVIGQNLCEKLSAWLGVKWKICFDLLVNKKHSFEATLIITSVFMTIFITPCVNSRKILIRDASVDSLALQMKFTFWVYWRHSSFFQRHTRQFCSKKFCWNDHKLDYPDDKNF